MTSSVIVLKGRRLAATAMPFCWLLATQPLAPAVAGDAHVVAYCNKQDRNDREEGVPIALDRESVTLLNNKGRRIALSLKEMEPCTGRGSKEPSARQDEGIADPFPPTAREEFEELVFVGSGTVAVPMRALVEAYAETYRLDLKTDASDPKRTRHQLRDKTGKPLLNITIEGSGSKTALPALIDRKGHVGMSSEIFADAEIAKIPGRKTRDEIERVLALDPIVLLAAPDNPVDALPLCAAARLFSGAARSWSEVGGAAMAVQIHARTGTSGTAEVFKDLVLDTCGTTLSADAIPHTSYPDVARAVADQRGAIGYAPLALAGDKVKSLRITGKCGLESAPTRFEVKTEDYALSRRLFLYAPYVLAGNAEKFLSFAISTDKAQDAIANSKSAIEQTIETRRDELRFLRPRLEEPGLEVDEKTNAELFRDTAGGERLSITFRFKSNSFDLDSKAWQDVLRLARRLPAIAGDRFVLLAGFTDSDGPQTVNRKLAERRALVVKDALLKVGMGVSAENLVVKGYGEILPVQCNDNDLGKGKNRRVEVWLLDRRPFVRGLVTR